MDIERYIYYPEHVPPIESYTLQNTAVVLDVDQVLADILFTQIKRYGELLGIEKTDEEILNAIQAPNCRMTFDISWLNEVRKKEKERFEAARTQILEDEELHGQFPPLIGAYTGSRLLRNFVTHYGGSFGGYYTARKPKAGTATPEWLRNNNFPDPENVTVCKDSRDKLMKIIDDFHLLSDENNFHVFLIDDSVLSLVEAANKLIEEDTQYTSALSKITIGAFSYDDYELSEALSDRYHPFYTITPFVSWRVDAIINLLSARPQQAA